MVLYDKIEVTYKSGRLQGRRLLLFFLRHAILYKVPREEIFAEWTLKIPTDRKVEKDVRAKNLRV